MKPDSDPIIPSLKPSRPPLQVSPSMNFELPEDDSPQEDPVQDRSEDTKHRTSQEWTLSRSVPDLRLGIVGSLSSGKSALVHRYLTGSYMQEESPEGGRFKKEILVDNQSYLLLIRDEGGPPELQVSIYI
ncbi:hypothetical protein QE152_g10557 [Popillia japonica]|uniref:Uncharacterized protein n=1 Tax=Popillia japonica TaxID=7064 RepID=A0AAW1LUF8_POPJA